MLKVIKLFDGDYNSNATDHSHKTLFESLPDFDSMSMLLIILYVVGVATILLILRFVYKRYCSSANELHTDKKSYVYNRIAYDGTNDHIIMEQDMHHAISDSSDEIEPNK